MNSLLAWKIDLAMQQSATFKSMRGNIHVQGLKYRESAQYRVAMMPGLINRILSVSAMWPDFLRNELVLSATRIVVKSLGMALMLALCFLQEYDIGIQFAQTVAEFVQHNAAIEMGKSFVDVVCSDG